MKNHKNSRGFVPIVIILIVLALIGGVYYLGTLKNKPSLVSNPPTSTPSSTSAVIPTASPTANWKTYTSVRYGFSIKYPNDWQVSESTVTQGVEFMSPETQKIMDNNDKLKTQEGFVYVVSDISISRQPTTANQDLGFPISQEKIDGQNFTLAKIEADPVYLSYFSQYKNSLYLIQLLNSRTPDSITATEKQILSTFKFTN